MLRFLTAGESHGKALVTIIEGVPAGLAIDIDAITADVVAEHVLRTLQEAL